MIYWDPYRYNSDQLFSQSVFLNSSINVESKIKLLKEVYEKYSHLSWTPYYLGSILASIHDYRGASRIWDSIPVENLNYFDQSISIIIAENLYICELAKIDCPVLEEKIRHVRNYKKWNEKDFQARINELRLQKKR